MCSSDLESGLTTTQSFLEWINAIVAPYTNGRHAVLVLDQWPAHITDSVKDRLRELNITMLEVPARGTALLQPLDAGPLLECLVSPRNKFRLITKRTCSSRIGQSLTNGNQLWNVFEHCLLFDVSQSFEAGNWHFQTLRMSLRNETCCIG